MIPTLERESNLSPSVAPAAVAAGPALAMRQIAAMFVREHRIYWRLPHLAVVSVLIPFAWMMLQGGTFVTAKSVLGFAAPNYLSFLSAFILATVVMECTMVLPITVLRDRKSGFFQKLLVFPITRRSVFAGTIAPLLYKTIAPAWILLLLFPLVGIPVRAGASGILLISAFIVLAAVGFGSIGMIVAMVARQEAAFFAVLAFIKLPLLVMTYGFFPRDFAPGWLRTVAEFNPLTYVIEPVRTLIVDGHVAWSHVRDCLSIVTAFSGGALVLAYSLFRRSHAL